MLAQHTLGGSVLARHWCAMAAGMEPGNRPIAQWAVFADRVMRVYRRKNFLIAGRAEDHVFASGEPIATVWAQFSRVRDALSTFRAFLEHLIELPNFTSGIVGLSAVETGESTSVASQTSLPDANMMSA